MGSLAAGSSLLERGVIHYHGLPITPETAAVRAISGGHAFVSFAHADQLSLAIFVGLLAAIGSGCVTCAGITDAAFYLATHRDAKGSK